MEPEGPEFVYQPVNEGNDDQDSEQTEEEDIVGLRQPRLAVDHNKVDAPSITPTEVDVVRVKSTDATVTESVDERQESLKPSPLTVKSTSSSPAPIPSKRNSQGPSESKMKKAKVVKKQSAKDHGKVVSASGTPSLTPTPTGPVEKVKKSRGRPKIDSEEEYISPIRVRLQPYKDGDINANPRLPLFLPSSSASSVWNSRTKEDVDLYLTEDHPFNRRGFRYIPCEPAPDLPLLMYRQIEVPPYGSRVNYADMSMQVLVDQVSATVVSTDKGYRMARANVCVREGKWFWECRILRGNLSPSDGNVRVGWTRREASLETPVGFDAYGYGIRDVTGQKMHISRGADFMKDGFKTGDVIGLYICLPSISSQLSTIHSNNPTKVSSKLLKPVTNDVVSNVVRDRIPIRYKGQLYFEQFECVPVKEFQDLLNQSSSDDVVARELKLREQGLPNSSIRVYKNGKYVGTPFESLLPFLPPHSAPLSTLGARVVDDGALGYYPSISVYQGGAAQFNFGPDFDYFPADLSHEASSSVDLHKRVRPMCERYDEQIAEDVVWDIVDEVEIGLNPEDLDRNREMAVDG
ncbi:uncharacterized protein V1513DRAFT_437610 [Lipomyces chichibuensis]|uniref:uncharacterized protein n=1 Tax=Lipomyces chichibuensis TaxID=1546026 RepID=UPI003343F785